MSVYEKGNVLAKLMIIGECPAREEEEQGVPFVGKSGQLLHEILEFVGIYRKDVLFTNVITSKQPRSMVDPSKKMYLINNGIPRLTKVIKKIQPRVIICMGDTAMTAMKIIIKKVPVTKSISKMNGDVDSVKVSYMDDELKIIYTLHPASALPNRNPENKRLIVKAISDNRDIIEPVIGRILRGIK